MTLLPTDARLTRQATGGDQRAFAAIFRRYHQDLYRFCLSLLGRPEDAQDALQNTMVKALHALPGEERQIELKPWLYRVAHNESIELLRRRREAVELDPERVTAASEPAETAALRERLRRLFDDLELLPERQRAALVMRELGGLSFEQIGGAFETSPEVARQTVYEARLSLRQLEAGREMSCERIAQQLSDGDGRVTRRRDIQAHLRACRDCRQFQEAIESRRRDFAALAPLPAATAASILHGLLGGQAASGGLAGGAVGTGGAAGAGAGKAVATSVAVKAVATAAVVATIGVTAADRGGLIDAGLPGGNSAAKEAAAGGRATARSALGRRAGGPQAGVSRAGEYRRSAHRPRVATAAALGTRRAAPGRPAQPEAQPTASPAGGQTQPAPEAPGNPPADAPHGGPKHDQENAAGHDAPPGKNPGQGRGHAKAKGAHSPHGEGDSQGGEHRSRGHSEDESGEGTGPGASEAKPPSPAGGKEKAPSEAETPTSPTEGEGSTHTSGDEEFEDTP